MMGNCIKLSLLCVFCFALCGCKGWEKGEKTTIASEDVVLHVYTLDVPSEEKVLRSKSRDLSVRMIKSVEYGTLARKMIETVSSPEQDGVGIAGPQIGILRRIVAVQRFDKQGSPFEVYPNIRISGYRGGKISGHEGCLSVPGKSGSVKRYQDIDISYTSPVSLRDTSERITGFTAVIFQHECDHLDGILYTDIAEAME